MSQDRASTIENVVVAKSKLAKVAFMSHDKASTIENVLIVGSALVNPAVLIHDNASANENVFIVSAKSTKEAKVSQVSAAGGVPANPMVVEANQDISSSVCVYNLASGVDVLTHATRYQSRAGLHQRLGICCSKG